MVRNLGVELVLLFIRTLAEPAGHLALHLLDLELRVVDELLLAHRFLIQVSNF